MDLFEALDTRASAARLSEPGPTPEQLDRILQAGVRAPDHGRLSPWRFLVLEGDGRRVLGEATAEAMRLRKPEMSDAELRKTADKVLRAPTLVVVTAAIQEHPKVPEVEQLATVAAGTQNMMLAAHALGLGAMWKTGAPLYSDTVKRALGMAEEEKLVGVLYLGTPVLTGEPRGLDARDFTRRLSA